MPLHSMWVHGHSATIQLDEPRGRGPGEDIDGHAWTAVVGFRSGLGAVYRGQDNSRYWFHFAIPTPVLHQDRRARLHNVTVHFNTDQGVTLSSVHVWDGHTRVFTKDRLAIGGLNVSRIAGSNFFGPDEGFPQQEILYGIGVSTLFHFADPGNVTLHTVGVDFDIP